MSSSQAIFLSLIFPIFNEEKNIEIVIKDHLRVIESLSSLIERWEIVCLNDASTDRSAEVLDKLQEEIPQMRILTHTTNQGINKTFTDLHHAANGTHIYHTATDGQWPADNLVHLLNVLTEKSSDAVIGVREDRENTYSLWRRLLSSTFNVVPKLLYGIDTKDANGIKLATKEFFLLDVKSESFFAEIERIIQAYDKGLTVDYAPVKFITRLSGKEKGAKWKNIFATLQDLFIYACTHKPNFSRRGSKTN